MSPTSFDSLNRRERRVLVGRSVLRIFVTSLAILALYIWTPVAGESGARAGLELVGGLIVFAALLVWQARSIVGAGHPELRAIEVMAVAIPILIIVFAFTYLSLSRADPASFSEPLDRVSAMYFTVTVLGTVGFGDIAAHSDAARILVSIQILLDLVLLVGIARTVVFAARVGVRRQQDGQTDPSGEQQDAPEAR